MDNLDQKIATIESTLERHSERILKIEGKLEKDYQSILSLLHDVKQLKEATDANAAITSQLVQKVQELDTTFSEFMKKMERAQTDQELKVLGIKQMLSKTNKLLWAAIVLSIGALVYATIRDGNIAGAITTLTGLITKIAI